MAFFTLFTVFILGGLLLPIILGIGVFLYISRSYPHLPSAHFDPKVSVDEVARQNALNRKGLALDAEPAELPPAFFTVLQTYDPNSVKEASSQVLSPNSNFSDSRSSTSSSLAITRDSLSNHVPSREKAKEFRRALHRKQGLYYVVLRLKHLMLYEDEDQLEPSHIFALDSYDVDVYGGMEATREGDLFVKRNSIRLRSKPSTNLTGSEVLNSIKELHFLTDNCAYKEDFYHALIRLQQELPSRTFAATPLTFEPADMARLVQLLHGSEANIQTRWFNVLVGRLFLALYRTPEAEAMIRAKVTRKLARIRTPSFLTAISIGRVDLGNSAPMISNPKLRELTIEGDMTIEMDVTYRGNFQIDVGTTARFDLGRRLGVRETSLMLKGTLKGLKGHILLRTKPPPSNRFWFTFETEPDFDLDIEPVVSTRLITYGPIIRAIESRVRDVIKETMVHPNWDDIPFLETTHKIKRGGLWQQDTTLPSELTDDTEADLATEPTLILPHSNESVVALPVEGATASDLEKAAESSVAVGGASQDEKSLRPITHTNTAPVGHAHMMASGLSARLSPMLTSLRRRPVATQQEVAPPLPARSSTMNISAAPPLPVRTQTTALEAAQRSVAATSGALSLQTNGKEEKESG